MINTAPRLLPSYLAQYPAQLLQRRPPAKPVPPHDQSHARKKPAYPSQRQHLHQQRKMTSHKGHQNLSQNQHFWDGYPTPPSYQQLDKKASTLVAHELWGFPAPPREPVVVLALLVELARKAW